MILCLMPNVIEESKSARAACRVCKEKIDKGVSRFGRESIFRRGDDEYKSMHWHHFECAAKKFPSELLAAEIQMELPSDLQNILDELVKGLKVSAFDVKGIQDFEDGDRKVNLKTKVARVMKVKEMADDKGLMRLCQSVYIVDDEMKSKLFLWDDKASTPVMKGDTIVVIDALTKLASNDSIQFHTTETSKVLINPTKEEIASDTKSIEVFIADSWSRPSGTPAEVEYAKSNRAACQVCGEKIMKGFLKVLKPVWLENEQTKSFFPSVESFHLNCAHNDKNGDDLIHEVVSRLTPEIVSIEKKVLKELYSVLPDKAARAVLGTILN